MTPDHSKVPAESKEEEFNDSNWPSFPCTTEGCTGKVGLWITGSDQLFAACDTCQAAWLTIVMSDDPVFIDFDDSELGLGGRYRDPNLMCKLYMSRVMPSVDVMFRKARPQLLKFHNRAVLPLRSLMKVLPVFTWRITTNWFGYIT